MSTGDPFRCPRCGETDVKVRGDGYKRCTSCPWEYRPTEDAGDQATIEDY